MKKSSDFIHRLIHGLSRSEKRYFSRFSNKHVLGGKQNKYVDLYEAISKQEVYDESALKKQFPKNFARSKNLLQEMVLNSLEEQHAAKDIEEQMKRQHHIAKILFDKGFYTECERLIQKEKRKAWKRRNYSGVLLFLQVELSLIIRLSKENRRIKYFEEVMACLRATELAITYGQLSFEMYHFYLQEGYTQTLEGSAELESFMNHPLLRLDNLPNDQKNLVEFYELHARYHAIKRNREASAKYGKKTLEVYEQNRDLIKGKPLKYFNIFMNYINDCLYIEKYEEFERALSDFKKLAYQPILQQIPFFDTELFAALTQFELSYCLGKLDFEKAISLLPTFEEQYEIHEPNMQMSYRVVLCYYISYVSFVINNFETALKWNDRILSNTSLNPHFERIVAFARIFKLIIHYELGNYRLLEHLLQAASRYYQKQKREDKQANRSSLTETTIIYFLKKLLNVVDKQEKHNLFKQFKMKLQPLREIEFEQQIMGYFAFIEWIDSKLQRKPFKAVLESLNTESK